MSSVKGKLANNDAQVQDVTVTDSNGKTALDVNVVSSASPTGVSDVNVVNNLIPTVYDRITITSKNGNGDPLVVEYRDQGTLVATLTLSYDIDGDLQEVVRT